MTVIFVGGVHGVGKSTCCAQVAGQLGCVHVTASDVIRKQKAEAIAAAGKLVAAVDENQELLLQGFEATRRLAGIAPILVDGHFALRNTDRVIQRLSPDVFAGLRVDRMVCFTDAVEAIVQRIGLRDGALLDVADVADLQEAELDNAQTVAKSLAVPLMILHGLDIEGLKRVVSGFGQSG